MDPDPGGKLITDAQEPDPVPDFRALSGAV